MPRREMHRPLAADAVRAGRRDPRIGGNRPAPLRRSTRQSRRVGVPDALDDGEGHVCDAVLASRCPCTRPHTVGHTPRGRCLTTMHFRAACVAETVPPRWHGAGWAPRPYLRPSPTCVGHGRRPPDSSSPLPRDWKFLAIGASSPLERHHHRSVITTGIASPVQLDHPHAARADSFSHVSAGCPRSPRRLPSSTQEPVISAPGSTRIIHL